MKMKVNNQGFPSYKTKNLNLKIILNFKKIKIYKNAINKIEILE